MISKRWLVGLAFGGMLALGCESREKADSDPISELRQAAAQAVPPGFQEELFLSGRTEPTALRFAPNGRLFVAEKSGLLWAYRSLTDTANPVRVIDLRAAVHNYWDRGLLGVAVHPQFPAVPHVYVSYTLDAYADGTIPRWGTGGPNPSTNDNCPSPPGGTDDGCVVYGRLSRIVVDPTTLVGTEQPLLSGNWCQQYPSHSIGDLAFGQDGYLYMTAGDGASFNWADFGQDGNPVNPCGDPPGGPMTGTNAEGGALRSQDLLTPSDPTSFDGTLLRLDVSGASVAAPADNPLRDNAVADDDLIVATGLRNPFRFTVRPGTNEVWIADVGWNAWEEINRVADVTGTVENFGWPCFEGNGQQSGFASRNLCQSIYAGSVPASMTVLAPYYTYSHSAEVVPGDGCGAGSSSITGLAFNTSSAYPPEYSGALFFADATRRCIWTMFASGGDAPNPASRQPFVTRASGRVVDLQMGPDGKLYYADFDGGSVYRIAYYVANTPPVASLVANPTSGAAPLAVAFDASASNDAEDGANLSFAWDLDGDADFDDAIGPLATATYTTSGRRDVTVRVTDSSGLSRTATQAIVVDNTPPVPVIDTPLATFQWTANETIAFSGHATDAEDGPLPPGQLSWATYIHHCATPDDCHVHPLTGISGVASGTFQAPDHEYPAFLEIRLTASDSSAGLWWDGAWRHRLPLVISGPLPATELTDVPVLVRLEPSLVPYDQMLPNGADLRFTDEAGTALSYEIESWNPAGSSSVWLKLPRVSAASAGARVFLYYGNPNATDAQSPPAVWSNGYRAVWHLGIGLADSTGNGNTGAAFGATPIAGAFGGAYQFDGTSAYLDFGAGSGLAVTSALSLEAYARVDDRNQDSYGRIVDKKTLWDAAAGYDLEYNPGQNLLSALGSGADYARGTIDLDTGWHFFSSSVSGGAGRVYTDGVDRTTDTTISPITASTQRLNVGRRSGGGDYFRGAIDEVRVASVARSAAWMALQDTSFQNALFSFGAPEQPDTLTATTSVILQPRTVDLEFQSVPPGLALTVRSEAQLTPFAETEIQGSAVTVSAPLEQELDGVTYHFVGWSDGGAATHQFSASASASPLVATYSEFSEPACTPAECDDSNVCTTDSCDPSSGCTHTFNTNACLDDGNSCTNDVCSAGACTHPDNGSCNLAPFQESGGQVVIEAEHFHSSVARMSHGWETLSSSSASGGQVVQATPNNGAIVNTGYTTTSPELRFQVNFVTTGAYNVWLRGSGPNADSDSCHAGLDGAGPASADRIGSFASSLGWTRSTLDGPVATVNVTTPGVHTVNVWMREDGAVLDKLILAQSSTFTPTGAGPAESPRQGTGGCTSPSQCNDNNPCTNDVCTAGVCSNPNNTAACADDGNACTSDVCSAGVCTHPSNGTCNSSPCSAYCQNPTTFTGPSFQSGNLGTGARCFQTTSNLNGGVCGNFASGRTLSINGRQLTCSGGNWSLPLPAKVNGGYCVYANAGDQAWAYFSTW